MACPVCKSDQFYVKDPDDAFEIHEFEIKNGEIKFSQADADIDTGQISDKREIFCQRCSWHGKKNAL